jgi:hypothetical protein
MPQHGDESTLIAAKDFVGRGWSPTPLEGKRPVLDGWQNGGIGFDECVEHWSNGRGHNVGILTGAPSGNLADVDLDSTEARALIAAPRPCEPFSPSSDSAGSRVSRSWSPTAPRPTARRYRPT